MDADRIVGSLHSIVNVSEADAPLFGFRLTHRKSSSRLHESALPGYHRSRLASFGDPGSRTQTAMLEMAGYFMHERSCQCRYECVKLLPINADAQETIQLDGDPLVTEFGGAKRLHPKWSSETLPDWT